MKNRAEGRVVLSRTCFAVQILLAVLLIQLVSSPTTKAQLSIANGASTFTLSDSFRVVEHPLPTNNSGPWAITVDSHDKVWFLGEGSNQLGSFDPASGTFQQFQIPTAHSTPVSVTSDTSGNIWFTELSGKLAELPHGGSQIVEYSVPGFEINLAGATQTLGCGPGAIVTDPSGRVWIACLFSNQIDEFFPANGSFDRFNLPVFPSAPAGIAFDGRGNLWFTAADSNMLGKAVIDQLRNNTSEGITEFAPLNQTYVFEFKFQASLLGNATTLKSSLPAPSGIAIDTNGRLWITEHIDSSFDSYNPTTGSLVRYWTSQTYGLHGYSATFPNGVSVGRGNTIWIAEHYGNRVAEFNSSAGQLTEYPVGCCLSSIAGVYTLALDDRGDPWFVEIEGNAIGELVPTQDQWPVSVSLQTAATVSGSHSSLAVPISFSEPGSAARSTRISLNVSGISSTGVPRNLTARFSPTALEVAPGMETHSNLTLSPDNLNPGVYYLTLTAHASPQNVLYSVILKLTVTGGSSDLLLPALIASAVLVAVLTFVSLKRLKTRRPMFRR